jgi:hypothetical protein
MAMAVAGWTFDFRRHFGGWLPQILIALSQGGRRAR